MCLHLLWYGLLWYRAKRKEMKTRPAEELSPSLAIFARQSGSKSVSFRQVFIPWPIAVGRYDFILCLWKNWWTSCFRLIVGWRDKKDTPRMSVAEGAPSPSVYGQQPSFVSIQGGGFCTELAAKNQFAKPATFARERLWGRSFVKVRPRSLLSFLFSDSFLDYGKLETKAVDIPCSIISWQIRTPCLFSTVQFNWWRANGLGDLVYSDAFRIPFSAVKLSHGTILQSLQVVV